MTGNDIVRGIFLSRTARTAVACFSLCACVVAAGRSADASTIEIFFSGINIRYDGTDITDVPQLGGAPDKLLNVTFTEDEVEVGSLSSGVTADLLIDNVLNIPLLGGTPVAATGPDSFLTLDFGGGNMLDLDLDTASVVFIDFSTVDLVFAASVASLVGESLPFGLSIDEPISVSFSTQVSHVTNLAGKVTSFRASGTGEIRGQSGTVPEAGSLVLMAGLGLLGAVGLRRRSRG